MRLTNKNMRLLKLQVLLFFLLACAACTKNTSSTQIIPIPNGDFENWDSSPYLLNWQTNSCPQCLPPYETYIVEKTSEAIQGYFAAKFIYNNLYSSYAFIKFPVSANPNLFTGYIKSNITAGDTAQIVINVFSNNKMIDSGRWLETSTSINYKKIEIPLSQTLNLADSISIKITGGHKQNTELFVDNLILTKN